MERNFIYMSNIKYESGSDTIIVFKDKLSFFEFIEQISLESKRSEQFGPFITTFTAVLWIDEDFNVSVIECSEQYVMFDFIFENKKFVDVKWFIYKNQDKMYEENVTSNLKGSHFIQYYDNGNTQFTKHLTRS